MANGALLLRCLEPSAAASWFWCLPMNAKVRTMEGGHSWDEVGRGIMAQVLSVLLPPPEPLDVLPFY